MNMIHRCDKFHKDSPSDKKVKFNFPSAIQLSETAVCVETLYINLVHARNFGCTFDQLFHWIILWNFYGRCLSIFAIPWWKKVKNDQKLKSNCVLQCSNCANGVYSLKWRLTDRYRYLRWGTLAGPRPGRADADHCKSSDFLQELRISGFPRFWVYPTCFRTK